MSFVIELDGMAWHGIEWRCMALQDMALYGVEWCGMAWHAVAWCCMALTGKIIFRDTCVSKKSPCITELEIHDPAVGTAINCSDGEEVGILG